ncbi:MAG: radical SAM protein [Desulfamplus sp.]|nr:radical SAM protein [Desulfamplus sp.]
MQLKINKSDEIQGHSVLNQEDRVVNKLLQKIINKERISIEDGLTLYHNAPILTLANLANQRRFEIHPERVITFVVDRNINYTNICMSGCKFCAFYKMPKSEPTIDKTEIQQNPCKKDDEEKSEQGYVISKESLYQKIKETIELGGTQILLQGGMNPALDLDYYVDLLKYIKQNFDIHIHGFSPPEISWLAKSSSMSVKAALEILKEAGLGSIPGGGAEILCDEIREKVSPNKCTSKEWLEVMEIAHAMGLKSSATMMFGHIESPIHIFEHLDKIRSLQDKTKGFTAFIPWTFQPDNTNLGKLNTICSDNSDNNTNNYTGINNKIKKASSAQYLRVLAISRLFLDNFDNIQASWVTQGDKIAQIALFYGANDMGSTMIEENVVASAGVDFMLPKEELCRLIQEAGFEPKQRDCFYNIIG